MVPHLFHIKRLFAGPPCLRLCGRRRTAQEFSGHPRLRCGVSSRKQSRLYPAFPPLFLWSRLSPGIGRHRARKAAVVPVIKIWGLEGGVSSRDGNRAVSGPHQRHSALKLYKQRSRFCYNHSCLTNGPCSSLNVLCWSASSALFSFAVLGIRETRTELQCLRQPACLQEIALAFFMREKCPASLSVWCRRNG